MLHAELQRVERVARAERRLHQYVRTCVRRLSRHACAKIAPPRTLTTTTAPQHLVGHVHGDEQQLRQGPVQVQLVSRATALPPAAALRGTASECMYLARLRDFRVCDELTCLHGSFDKCNELCTKMVKVADRGAYQLDCTNACHCWCDDPQSTYCRDGSYTELHRQLRDA